MTSWRNHLLGVVLVVSAGFHATAEAAFFERFLMPGPLAQAHAEFEDRCDACHKDGDGQAAGPVQACLDCHDHENVAQDIEQKRGYHGRLPQIRSRGCSLCHDEHRGRDADILNFQPAIFDHAQTDFELRYRHTTVPCLGCHPKDTAYREAKSRCFDCHERSDPHDGRLGEKCEDCHSEKGWRDSLFDHDRQTDYKLEGRHAEIQCALCHVGNQYEDTPTECIECHKVDDVHLGANGKNCDTCHQTRRWKEIRFDHDAKTDFALRGEHRDLDCDACHSQDPKREARKPKTACVDCHRADDVHKGRNGKDCKQCHSEKSWSESAFDHDRKTDFKLTGQHRELNCSQCHKGNPEDEKDRTACVECHAHNDAHKGVFGEICKDCHDTKKWTESSYEHGRETAFALDARHGEVACILCHTLPTEFQKLSMECYDCHRSDDAHKGQLGRRCENCHAVKGWVAQTRFDHDLTRFPLLGQHGVQSCEACHDSMRFQETDAACNACHAVDDLHKATLGTDCQRCHNPNAWTAWMFDHQRQTDFKLEGPHADLNCANCHTSPTSGSLSQSAECYICHQADDIHAGGFGRNCRQCHQGESFSEISLPN